MRRGSPRTGKGSGEGRRARPWRRRHRFARRADDRDADETRETTTTTTTFRKWYLVDGHHLRSRIASERPRYIASIASHHGYNRQ